MSKRVEGLSLRFAHADEHAELEALQRLASLANEKDRPHLEAHPDAIELPLEQIKQQWVVVAEIQGRIVGFSAMIPEESHLELDGLFVDPDHWRRGIGEALVQEAAHEARRRGLSLMVVANPQALEFYRKCGFSEEGIVQTRFGPGIRMSR